MNIFVKRKQVSLNEIHYTDFASINVLCFLCVIFILRQWLVNVI